MIPRLLDKIQCKLFLRTNFTDYIKGNYLFGIFKIGFVVKVHFEIVFAVIFLFFVSWPEIFYVPLVLLVFYSNQLTILYIYFYTAQHIFFLTQRFIALKSFCWPTSLLVVTSSYFFWKSSLWKPSFFICFANHFSGNLHSIL